MSDPLAAASWSTSGSVTVRSFFQRRIALVVVRPMSKHTPVELRCPSRHHRWYRVSWSAGSSSPPHSTNDSARHSAIDVSSVHCPGRRPERSPTDHVVDRLERARPPELERRPHGVAGGEAEQRSSEPVAIERHVVISADVITPERYGSGVTGRSDETVTGTAPKTAVRDRTDVDPPQAADPCRHHRSGTTVSGWRGAGGSRSRDGASRP